MRKNKKTNILTIVFISSAACLMYAINGGIRSNYGILLRGIINNTGIEYSQISFVMAVSQLVVGIMQPVFGILAVKKSNGYVLSLGAILITLGLIIMPISTTVFSLMLSIGILLAAGFGALSFGVIMGAITPVLGVKRSATVSGIVTASSGLGSVVLSPLMNFFILKFGLWGCALMLCIPTALVIPIALWLSKTSKEKSFENNESISIKDMLKEAFSSKAYLLMLFAFFTCGFHMAIIETHLFSNMTSKGIADNTASYLFSIYGIITMIGSVLTGVLSSKFKMKWVAGGTFLTRGIIILLFLLLPKNVLVFGIFASFLGFTGAATVPPISGLTLKLFGQEKLSILFGILMVSHQIGSFFSAWLGGISINSTGEYNLIWISTAILSTLAATSCFLIKEEN